ncbi:MAG: hypothetical protein WC444_01345 [Candidatus Paceibacterota bacterium]
MIHHARHDHFAPVLLYGGAIIAVFLLSLIASPMEGSRLGIIAPQKAKEETSALFTSKTFDTVTVRAKAYIVYDIVDEKIIASKNETAVLPLASISKIMMAMTARIHHDMKTTVTIGKIVPQGGFDLGLKKGQTWKLSELLKYTLVFSSNDGAQAIANTFGGHALYVEQMNTDAALLGLALHFTDPAGLDVNGKLGGEGTVLDVAKLLVAARKRFPELLDATTHARLTVTASTGKVSGIPNTNQVITNLSGAEASKTGFTDSAGGNLAVIVDITVGHPVAIVVLGSTRDERFSDVEILYNALRKSVTP